MRRIPIIVLPLLTVLALAQLLSVRVLAESDLGTIELPPPPVELPPLQLVVVGSVNITLDCNLSDWGTAATLFTISPTSQADFLTFYFAHNNTHLLVAGYLYDPDPTADDTVALYINTSSGVQSWKIEEDSTTTWYCATASSIAAPYWKFEAAIPNSSIGLSVFYLLVEYENTYRTTYRVYIPTGANMSDPYTWIPLRYYVPPPSAAKLRIRLLDREGHDASILGSDTFLMVSNETWMSLWLTPLDGVFSLNLSPGVYTIDIGVLGCAVGSVEINLTASGEWNLSLNNLLIVETPRGWLAVCADYVADITAAMVEVEKGYGVVVLNASDITLVSAVSNMSWHFTAVLFADNFTYNPLTNRLVASVGPGTRTLVFLMGVDEPAVYYSNATLTRLSYDASRRELVMRVNASIHLEVYHTHSPHAVALNASALKRGRDWVYDDLLNITTVNCSAGSLTIYYSNPVRVEAHALSPVTVFISTPYAFHARIEVVEAGARKEVYVPAGGGEYILEVDQPGTYTVRVYDLDSDTVVGTATVTVSEAPEAEEVVVEVVPWWVYALLTVAVAAVLAVLALRGAVRAVVERGRRYWIRE